VTGTSHNKSFRVGSGFARAPAGLRDGYGLDQLDRRVMRLVGARREPHIRYLKSL
jgi:hypothetical protein